MEFVFEMSKIYKQKIEHIIFIGSDDKYLFIVEGVISQ